MDLTDAEKEASLLESMYKDTVTTLLKEEATETRFKKEIGNYDIIHIATHGVFNSHNPMSSLLKFAPDPLKTDDGNLSASEIYGLNVNATLVTLSACQTGKVDFNSGGNEILGLTRGFLFAGAKNLVITLWDIDDEATLYLMEYFYTTLPQKGLAQALRDAQLQVLQQQELKHPAFWSAFHLVGYGAS